MQCQFHDSQSQLSFYFSMKRDIYFIEGNILLSLMKKKYLSTLPLDHAPPFGLIVHNLFICSLLALILRKGQFIVSKKRCALASRFSKDQRCPTDLDKSGFHFQLQQSLFERSFNHV